MNRSTLIFTDALFVITVFVIYYGNNGDINQTPLFLRTLVCVAFATCIIRHINYYKLTKRIY